MVQDEKKDNDFILREVHTVLTPQQELKTQTTFEVGKWDTSKMDGFKEGDRVLTGYNLSIRTLKPDKKFPRQRVDIDIGDEKVRALLLKAIKSYEQAVKQ